MEILAQISTSAPSMEVWKLVVQGVGPLVAMIVGLVALWHARWLEDKRFEYKLKEVSHTKTQERRLAALEEISKLTGEYVYEMSYFPVMIDDFKPSVEKKDGENHTKWLSDHFAFRKKELNAVRIRFYLAVQTYAIYLSDDLVDRLQNFRTMPDQYLTTFENERMASHGMQDINVRKRFDDGVGLVQKERGLLVQQIRDLMTIDHPKGAK